MGNLIKKILIAPNSYKESMDSVSAVKLLFSYLTDERYELITFPISDGGDGFLEVCKNKFGMHNKTENWDLPYYYNHNTKTVYIESAELIGMKVIPQQKRNPLKLNSSALGDLLLHLKSQVELKVIDLEEVVIGVGGTAIMDMGLGAASSFGLKIFDDNGNELPVIPSEFTKAVKIIIPEVKLPFKITTVNDVTNPLLGEDGGLKVYGPQKGASDDDIDLIEKGVENILSIILPAKGNIAKHDEAQTLLPGAGGGLSAGLLLFFNTEMKSSEQFILNDLGLNDYRDKVDYIITGEGTFDKQSFNSKAAGLVIKTFPQTPIFLCCGVIDDFELPDNVIPVELSRYFTSKEESMQNMPAALEAAAGVIKTYISQSQGT